MANASPELRTLGMTQTVAATTQAATALGRTGQPLALVQQPPAPGETLDAYAAKVKTGVDQMREAKEPVATFAGVRQKDVPLSVSNMGTLLVNVTGIDVAGKKVAGTVVGSSATPNITGVPGTNGIPPEVTLDLASVSGFFAFRAGTIPDQPDPERPDIPDPTPDQPQIPLKDPRAWATEGAGIDLNMQRVPGGLLDPATLLPQIGSGSLTEFSTGFQQGTGAVDDLLNLWMDARDEAPGTVNVYLVAMTRRDDASDAKALATFQVVGADPSRGVARVVLVLPPALAAGRQGIVYEFPVSVFGGGIAVTSERGFAPVGPRPLPPIPGQ